MTMEGKYEGQNRRPISDEIFIARIDNATVVASEIE